jgi:hypothetical protein
MICCGAQEGWISLDWGEIWERHSGATARPIKASPFLLEVILTTLIRSYDQRVAEEGNVTAE